ncbi:MAG TPA: neutral zinc metallopeptidase [Planctomycetia bacterium]|nr:neutral zinc metallopeptidase [Planctomycetia bacterium]
MRWEGQEESGNVEDRRGMSRGMAIGGGSIVVLLLAWALGLDPRLINALLQGAGQVAPQQQQQGEAPAGKDDRTRHFTATIMRFTEKVWGERFQEELGKRYVEPKMVLFSEGVQTGCGNAPSAVGPFYCPADQTVYLDPTFFDELEKKLGGSKAEFSQAYVIAHEVGHHVQNQLGFTREVEKRRRGGSEKEANQYSVRLELQADYLAGVWAHYGQRQFQFIEAGDVEAAMKSANAIGDDRLQKRSTGFVSPEGFTHGTSAQRTKWFKRGLETGKLQDLNLFFQVPYDQL